MITPPTLFLSHAHQDKHIARRLARELRPYGFRIWIDEAELRFGAVLTPTLRAHIEEADALLVVASAASAASRWVALEVGHAVEHGKPVVPVMVEQVADADLFRDHLGVDATSSIRFAEVVRRLMTGLLPGADPHLREPDPAVLEADLRALAVQEPDLRPLVLGYLDGEGVGYEHTALYDVEFHALDYALTALVELRRTEAVAYSAAAGFHRVGAGAAALARWIAISGDGGLPLVSAVGERLAPELVDPALDLLRACEPPNNHGLYQFIHRNSEQLSPQQRLSVISLVTWPQRGPERLGNVLGRVALEHFPDAPQISQMWQRWIWAGSFDGAPGSPSDLARALALAEEHHVPGLDRLYEPLRSHVRRLLRSGDKRNVALAVDHLRANVDQRTGAVAALAGEAAGVSGTAEWKAWAERDRETADQMARYVFAFWQQAESGGDWSKAMQDFDRLVEFDRLRRQRLAED